jgi:CubicO group peptidase (beta-lactamase class C family)
MVSDAEAALSFWDLPYLDDAYIETSPQQRSDGIRVGELNVSKAGHSALELLAQQFAEGELGDYDSLLIAHNGALVLESYYKRGRIDLPHFQASVTKGYTALAVGRAIQMGYLSMADLYKPVVDMIAGLDASTLVAGADKITLHQAMTMSSGLRFTSEQLQDFRDNPQTFHGIAQTQAFLSLSQPISDDSQTYQYQPADPMIVMQVIDSVVPQTAKVFLQQELLNKLAIDEYTWHEDISGLVNGASGASVTSRDMLKIGLLINQGGLWNGEQLISMEFLNQATSRITEPAEDWIPDIYSYGYYYYHAALLVAGEPYSATVAWGGGGNRIIVVKELDLTIIMTGHDRGDDIFEQLADTILPAFVD